ncbi:hypothetical protein BDV06DRAFT_220627 [Aspergillus oleicola]
MTTAMRPLRRLISFRTISFSYLCRLPKTRHSFSQIPVRMNSNTNQDWYNIVIPEKCPPDTRPPEGHERAIPYLYSPLPDELPSGVHKDPLLLYAAYVGNIDRYVRLRDPTHMIKHELECIIRGIYHDTMFAKWWSLQPDHPDADADGNLHCIRAAIHARFIMNNDLLHIEKETKVECLPYLIWYPHFATWGTYEELARRQPGMKAQAARACIAANYKDSYQRINPTPDYFLVEQARNQADATPFYLEDLLRRAKEMGIDVEEEPCIDKRWKLIEGHVLTYWRAFMVPPGASLDCTVDESEYWQNCNGHGVDLSGLELFVSVPEELREKARRDGRRLDLRHVYLQACRPGEST